MSRRNPRDKRTRDPAGVVSPTDEAAMALEDSLFVAPRRPPQPRPFTAFAPSPAADSALPTAAPSAFATDAETDEDEDDVACGRRSPGERTVAAPMHTSAVAHATPFTVGGAATSLADTVPPYLTVQTVQVLYAWNGRRVLVPYDPTEPFRALRATIFGRLGVFAPEQVNAYRLVLRGRELPPNGAEDLAPAHALECLNQATVVALEPRF